MGDEPKFLVRISIDEHAEVHVPVYEGDEVTKRIREAAELLIEGLAREAVNLP